jgi:outer membrane biosynthesis protein TonB
MVRRHQTTISFIISILLHLLFLLLYIPLGKIELFPVTADDLKEKPQVDENRIVFELVETPEDARSEEPPEEAHLVSDKNSIARDRNRDENTPSGDPYSEGDLDVKEVLLSQQEVLSPQSPSVIQASEDETDPSREEKKSTSSPEGHDENQLSVKEFLARIAPSQNSHGQDHIPPRPLYDNETSQAEEYGGLTFNTYDWNFAPYLLEMKRKIEKNMHPPPAFTRFGLISGKTVIRFRVMPDGKVVTLKVLSHDGHESLKITSEQAILQSSAFSPLPRDFPEDFLEVTCSFQYIVSRSK